MKKALAFLLFILSFGTAGAENVVVFHDFHELFYAVPQQLVLSNSSKVGTVGDVVYTCSGTNAKFNLAFTGAMRIAINLPSSDCEVVTTQFNNLSQIIFMPVTPDNIPSGVCDNIKIKLSTDGSIWEEVPSDSITYRSGEIKAVFTPGNYYVKIYNTRSYRVSILQTKFYLVEENCNCFTYTP